jgi:hypothetical protein
MPLPLTNSFYGHTVDTGPYIPGERIAIVPYNGKDIQPWYCVVRPPKLTDTVSEPHILFDAQTRGECQSWIDSKCTESGLPLPQQTSF